MPIRPTSMVKMMTSFPEILSNGLHLLLRRACLSAIMTKIPFSVYIKTRQIRKEHMDGH